MTRRDAAIGGFLRGTGWAEADATMLAGDASNRRYLRLTRADGARAVLMDAPPERGEDLRPFLRIAEVLSARGFSAPRIVAADTTQGLALLEDLGDALFARVLERAPQHEDGLYSAATDVLIELHETPPPADLPAYDSPLMADLAMLAFDWYAPDAAAHRADTRATLHDLLQAHVGAAQVLALRDYHAENLLWLPERHGIARVGLLDFQDAMRGPRGYDLVSLTQDARRDVAPGLEARMIARYTAATGQDAAALSTACAVLGAQRNLRIIGVFARLCLRDGKPHYLRMLPRVWAHLQRDLADPALAPLAAILRRTLPAPDPVILQGIETRCTIVPTP